VVGGSGDDRLSRRGHYHGPGGLNGRVRDGNGWGPAGLVAGRRAGGDEAPTPATDWLAGRMTHPVRRDTGARVGARSRDRGLRGPPGAGRPVGPDPPSGAALADRSERAWRRPPPGRGMRGRARRPPREGGRGRAAGPAEAAPRRRTGGAGIGVGSGWSSRSAVRTGRLRRSPAVHSRPIDLVVSQEPSWPKGQRKPGLGGGFALRCLQRLSGPDLATRRCPERDSRHTRGRSSPILSY